MPQPEISVVIPTHCREERLAFALDALAEQTLDGDRYEVIVVRSSARGPLTEAPAGLRVRWLVSAGPSVSRRRNLGWRGAAAPLVAFTDDDCRPEPDWLERLLAAAEEAGAILQGRTEPDRAEIDFFHRHARSIRILHAHRWYPTCNIAYPRALLERLDGFDERLAFRGEDTDLGMRAEREGAKLVYVDEAVVWHAVHWRSLRAALRDATQRHSEPGLVARHPELGDELYLGVFISEEHFRWTLAALGGTMALLGGDGRLALLLAYPYVMAKVGARPLLAEFRTPMGILRLGGDVLGSLLVDAVEVGTRARASLGARRLVL